MDDKLLAEIDIMEYETGACSFFMSVVYRRFPDLLYCKCRRKYKRYLGYMKYRELMRIKTLDVWAKMKTK